MTISRFTLGAGVLAAVVVLGACVNLAAAPSGNPLPTRPAAATSGPAAPSQAGPTQTDSAAQPTGAAIEGNLCHIVTLEEVSAAAGGAPAVLGADYDLEGECNWDVGEPNELGTPAAFVNLRVDFSNALDDARTLFPDGEDVAVGDDAYWMPDLNVLNFAKNGRIYAVQIALVDSEAIDPRALAIALGTTAASRL